MKRAYSWSLWWWAGESIPARWLRAAYATLLGEMPVLAAGTALFAIIALVPTLGAVVAIYGLAADPSEIHGQLGGLERVLPTELVAFVGDQLDRQVQRSSGELGLQLLVSVAIAVLSARGSARALIDALNRAYRVRELRAPLRKLYVSLIMAAAALLGLMLMFAVLVVLPALAAAIDARSIELAMWLRWPAMLVLLFGALLALYRYAPSPRPLGGEKHVCLPGAVTATVLLIVVSWMLSLWVETVVRTDLIYGAFGSVIVLLLWFYLSTMALVVGGFVNAELERHAGAPAPERSMY